jgi:hypothetical protein
MPENCLLRSIFRGMLLPNQWSEAIAQRTGRLGHGRHALYSGGGANTRRDHRFWSGQPDGSRRQIAGSACGLYLPAARSVWPRTNDLGALDLSARSGADRMDDAIANRQICATPQWRAGRRPPGPRAHNPRDQT